jgi:pyridoxamine 5'-phosphate oxidase
MVLVKEVTPAGLIFYSDGGSRKGRELRHNPRAAVCLHWPSLGRQLRVEGPVRRLAAAEVDTYFHSRPRASQLAAAVSQQSQRAPSRAELEARVDRLAGELGEDEVPRPRRWAGYLLKYEVVEFWREGPGRLHHRLEYRRLGAGWQERELQP